MEKQEFHHIVIMPETPTPALLARYRQKVDDIELWMIQNDINYELPMDLAFDHFLNPEYTKLDDADDPKVEEVEQFLPMPGYVYELYEDDRFDTLVWEVILLPNGRFLVRAYLNEEGLEDPDTRDFETLEEAELWMGELLQQLIDHKWAKGRERPCYLAVGLADKAYGGPEEGGWYYDTWEFQHGPGIPMVTSPHPYDVEEYMAELESWCATMNEGRPSINSVNSEGRWEVRVFHETLPHSLPTERVRYE